MNVRDPFELHRSPAFQILRGSARQAAAHVTHRVWEAGTQAYETSKQAVEDMPSFSIPNGASFPDPQRDIGTRHWGAPGTARAPHGLNNGGVISDMQDRVGGLFEKPTDLPMYKDKPYSYASSRRRKPLWRRKRTFGIGAVFSIFVLYLCGFFTRHDGATDRPKNRWSLLQMQETGGSQVDWLGRRERVKEAFTLSWDAYERYAWGKYTYLRCLSTQAYRY